MLIDRPDTKIPHAAVVMGNGKVIRNPYLVPDQWITTESYRKNSNTSRVTPWCHLVIPYDAVSDVIIA